MVAFRTSADPCLKRFLAGLLLFLVLAVPGNATSTGSPSIGGDFSLTAHDGNRFSLESLRGSIVLIYFGFTSCPSICPMELSHIGRAMDSLGDLAVSGVFITVDPERDTVDKLADYVPFFHPDLIGLTGTADEIRKVADQYNVNYRRAGHGPGYTVDHSSQIIILDDQGAIRALAPFGATAEHLVKVVRGIAESMRE